MSDKEPTWEPTTSDRDAGAADASAFPPADASEAVIREEPDGIFASIRWGLISFIVLSVIVIILAAQNTQSVSVKALGWEVEAPLIVIILITVLVTVVLDELVGLIIRRRRRTRTEERRELKRLRKERDA